MYSEGPTARSEWLSGARLIFSWHSEREREREGERESERMRETQSAPHTMPGCLAAALDEERERWVARRGVSKAAVEPVACDREWWWRWRWASSSSNSNSNVPCFFFMEINVRLPDAGLAMLTLMVVMKPPHDSLSVVSPGFGIQRCKPSQRLCCSSSACRPFSPPHRVRVQRALQRPVRARGMCGVLNMKRKEKSA